VNFLGDTWSYRAIYPDGINDDFFSCMVEHGVVIVEVAGNEMLVDFHHIPDKLIGEKLFVVSVICLLVYYFNT